MDLARDVDPILLAELTSEVFYPVYLVRIDHPVEMVELHTGAGNIEFDGATFLGTKIGGDELGRIEVPAEQAGLIPQEATFSLIGPYDELIERLNTDVAGRLVQMWVGCTTEPGGNVLIGTPFLAFTGAVSGDRLPPPREGVSGIALAVKAGTHGRMKGAISHSDEEQQANYPGDTLFERTARAISHRATPPLI